MRKWVAVITVALVVAGCGRPVPKERFVGNNQSGTVSRKDELSGDGRKVHLPAGPKPEVTNSGIDCDVLIEPAGK